MDNSFLLFVKQVYFQIKWLFSCELSRSLRLNSPISDNCAVIHIRKWCIKQNDIEIVRFEIISLSVQKKFVQEKYMLNIWDLLGGKISVIV